MPPCVVVLVLVMNPYQTPQDFFNLVPSVDVLGQRYLAFYDFLMPCWEGHNTVPCCGTNVVFSRAALASIGGLSTVTITEDVHTSMKLTGRRQAPPARQTDPEEEEERARLAG